MYVVNSCKATIGGFSKDNSYVPAMLIP